MGAPLRAIGKLAVGRTVGQVQLRVSARKRAEALLARHGSVENLLEEVPCAVCGTAPSVEAFRAPTRDLTFFPIVHPFVHRRCGDCGLVWVSPRLRQDVLRELYETDYVEMDVLTEPQVEKKGRNAEAWTRHVRSEAPPSTHPRLLDVGCGHGHSVIASRHEGYDAVGQEFADLSPIWRQVDGLSALIRTAPLEDAAVFGDASADIVTLWEVAEHLQDPRETFESIARILRPGGLLALESPRADCVSLAYLGPRWSQIIPEQHLYLWTRDSLTRMLDACGFDVRDVRDSVTPRDVFTGRIYVSAVRR
jgi:SAM-dependent methyltransferase